MRRQKLQIMAIALISLAVGVLIFSFQLRPGVSATNADRIRWVDFNVSYEALKDTMELDIESYEQEVHIDWVSSLAYLGAKYGGNFDYYEKSDLDSFAKKLRSGKELSSFTKKMKFFSYYKKAYGAILNGMIGPYKVEVPSGDKVVWQHKYGLKAFSPIASGYWYTHCDDFGVGRSYGYSRKHFGHDLMASTGTPVVAVESGTIEAIGWNQYGGWRLGIRSVDKQRYYYYAHLRKDHPYSEYLYVGKTVAAGDVIGYTGQTGYSIKENTNNIETPHLHYGMQLVFDEKAKDGPNQVWVDLYAITKLLSSHKSQVHQKGNDYYRTYRYSEESYIN